MQHIITMQLCEKHRPGKGLIHVPVKIMIAQANIFHPMENYNVGTISEKTAASPNDH